MTTASKASLFSFTASVMLVFAAAFAVVVERASAGAAAGDEPEARARLSPESNPHAILLSAFEESGWPIEHALAYADQAMSRLGFAGFTSILPSDLPPVNTTAPGHALLSPSTNPHATILDAFIASGWSVEEALANTEHCLVKAGRAANTENGCQVWRVKIQYCESGRTRYFDGYLNTQCYWQLFPDPLPCDFPICQSPNVSWYTMHTTAGCGIGYTGCVRVNFVQQLTVDCSLQILECSCFVEDSCDDITNVDCCPPLSISGSGGCSNCPCSS